MKSFQSGDCGHSSTNQENLADDGHAPSNQSWLVVIAVLGFVSASAIVALIFIVLKGHRKFKLPGVQGTISVVKQPVFTVDMSKAAHAHPEVVSLPPSASKFQEDEKDENLYAYTNQTFSAGEHLEKGSPVDIPHPEKSPSGRRSSLPL